jgi:glycine cleavage system regulatory protein
MSGQPMFEAKAEIVVPEGVEDANLRTTLEALAKDLMVDVDLAECDGRGEDASVARCD